MRNTQESGESKGDTTKEIRKERHLHVGCQEQMGKHPRPERTFSERRSGGENTQVRARRKENRPRGEKVLGWA